MEEPGKEAPADPPPAKDRKSNPPSPKASPKKLVVRNLSSRHKTRKTSTPYSTRSQGPAKRNPLSSIPENNPVRKKIAFEIPVSFTAGKNGDAQVGTAGSSMDGDADMESALEDTLRPTQNMPGLGPRQSTREAPGDGDEGMACSLMTVVQHMEPNTSRSNCTSAGGDEGACTCDIPIENSPNPLSERQDLVTPFSETCNDNLNLVSKTLTEEEMEFDSTFPPLIKGETKNSDVKAANNHGREGSTSGK